MDELLAKDTARLADLMGSAERCVVLTGVRMGATEETEAQAAGSSWSEISSIEVLLADPARFWEHWLPRALESAERTPRVEHEAIARLQRSGVIKGLITLGVDDLHRKGGSPEVVEVHANVMSCRCSRCDDVYALGEVVGLRQRSEDGVPRCTRDDCTFPLRPTGTLWGEPLVEAAVIKAWDLGAWCDLFVVLDTQLRTDPMAMLPSVPLQAQGRVAMVGATPTRYDRYAEIVIRWPAPEVIVEVARILSLNPSEDRG